MKGAESLSTLDFDLENETQNFRLLFSQDSSEHPSPRLQFEFASLLLCSSNEGEILEAVELLKELLRIGANRSDCLYQISMAYFKLGDYANAKQSMELMLKMEPRNLLALSFHSVIVDRIFKDGLLQAVFMCSIAGGYIFYLYNRYRNHGKPGGGN